MPPVCHFFFKRVTWYMLKGKTELTVFCNHNKVFKMFLRLLGGSYVRGIFVYTYKNFRCNIILKSFHQCYKKWYLDFITNKKSIYFYSSTKLENVWKTVITYHYDQKTIGNFLSGTCIFFGASYIWELLITERIRW